MARKKAPANKGGIDYYEGADGWRWRLRAPNGNIVADSGESYRRISGAQRGFRALVTAIYALPDSVTKVVPAPAPPRKRKQRDPELPPPAQERVEGYGIDTQMNDALAREDAARSIA
jgi:hypothetical protein